MTILVPWTGFSKGGGGALFYYYLIFKQLLLNFECMNKPYINIGKI